MTNQTSTTYGTKPSTQKSIQKPAEETPVLDPDTLAPNQPKL